MIIALLSFTISMVLWLFIVTQLHVGLVAATVISWVAFIIIMIIIGRAVSGSGRS